MLCQKQQHCLRPCSVREVCCVLTAAVDVADCVQCSQQQWCSRGAVSDLLRRPVLGHHDHVRPSMCNLSMPLRKFHTLMDVMPVAESVADGDLSLARLQHCWQSVCCELRRNQTLCPAHVRIVAIQRLMMVC